MMYLSDNYPDKHRYRPDPAVMVDFDLWTMNSKVFPAIDPIVARTGERVRIRMANLSMWNHPIHIHGHSYWVTGSDGGRWPKSLWRPETTEIVGVGQIRDIEFIAVPGDWAFHCHMSHHTMNAMGHSIANPMGVNQAGIAEKVKSLLPGYVAMGESGMAEHAEHLAMAEGGMKMEGMENMQGMQHGMQHGAGFEGPRNTLPMMTGTGPFGSIEMGGMFTVVKIRDGEIKDKDAGWYDNPPGTVAKCVSRDRNFTSSLFGEKSKVSSKDKLS
jgi:manganese oxidase